MNKKRVERILKMMMADAQKIIDKFIDDTTRYGDDDDIDDVDIITYHTVILTKLLFAYYAVGNNFEGLVFAMAVEHNKKLTIKIEDYE